MPFFTIFRSTIQPQVRKSRRIADATATKQSLEITLTPAQQTQYLLTQYGADAGELINDMVREIIQHGTKSEIEYWQEVRQLLYFN